MYQNKMSKYDLFATISHPNAIKDHSPSIKSSSASRTAGAGDTTCCVRCYECCLRNGDHSSSDDCTVTVSGEYEYVVEKLVVKKIPLILSGRQEDVQRSLVQLATRKANMIKACDTSQDNYSLPRKDIRHPELHPYILMRSSVEKWENLNLAEVHKDKDSLHKDSRSYGHKRRVNQSQIEKENEDITKCPSNDTFASRLFAMIPREEMETNQRREEKDRTSMGYKPENTFSRYIEAPLTIAGRKPKLETRGIKRRCPQSEKRPYDKSVKAASAAPAAPATVKEAGQQGSRSLARSGFGDASCNDRARSGSPSGSGSGSPLSVLCKRPSIKSIALSKESDVLLEESKPLTEADSSEKPFYIDVSGRLPPQTDVHSILNKYSSIFLDNLKDPVPKDPLTLSQHITDTSNNTGENSAPLMSVSRTAIADATSGMRSNQFLRAPSPRSRSFNGQPDICTGSGSHIGTSYRAAAGSVDSSTSMEKKFYHLRSFPASFETRLDENTVGVLDDDSSSSDDTLNAPHIKRLDVRPRKYIDYDQVKKREFHISNRIRDEHILRQQNLIQQDTSSEELGNVELCSLSHPASKNVDRSSFDNAENTNKDLPLNTSSNLHHSNADFQGLFMTQKPLVLVHAKTPNMSVLPQGIRSDANRTVQQSSTQNICKLSEGTDMATGDTLHSGAVKRWKIIIKHCKDSSTDSLKNSALDESLREKI